MYWATPKILIAGTIHDLVCQVGQNEEEGAGIQEIYNKAFWGQVNFFEARPNPFPPPTQAM